MNLEKAIEIAVEAHKGVSDKGGNPYVLHPLRMMFAVNTDEEQALASHFNIRSIPTLMIFKENIIIFSQAGSLPASALEEVITKAKDLDMDVVRDEIDKQQQQQAKA